jgi:hypothetical protein
MAINIYGGGGGAVMLLFNNDSLKVYLLNLW